MAAAVSIVDVVKHFGSLQALAGVSLVIEEGEFFGLLGPNGAGKTTLISCLAGLIRPDSGTLKVLGHDVINDFREARRLLGVVPQELVFDPFFNVRETLQIQSGYFGIRKNDDWIDEILHNLDLTSKANVAVMWSNMAVITSECAPLRPSRVTNASRNCPVRSRAQAWAAV